MSTFGGRFRGRWHRAVAAPRTAMGVAQTLRDRGGGTVGRYGDCEHACLRGGGLAAEEVAAVHTVDPSRRTEERPARVPAPADGAVAVAEPQRPVGLHRSVR